MARIETYGPPSVRLAPKAAPQLNPNVASPDAFGAGIADGFKRGSLELAEGFAIKERKDEELRQKLEKLQKIQQQAIEKARQTRVIQRDNQLSEAEDDILYHPQTGVMFAEGEGAAKATQDYDDRFNSKVDEIAKTLEDPQDQELFRQQAEARRVATRSRVDARAGNVLRKHEQDTMDAAITRTRTDALRVFQDAVDSGNPDEIQRATASLTASIDKQVAGRHYLERDLRKASPQEADLLAQNDASETHVGAIDALVARGKFKEARAYYQGAAAQIAPSRRDAIARDLTEGATNQEAQDTADAIFKSGYALKKADADKMVGQIEDADLRQRTQIKVDQEWARREAALKDARGATFEDIARSIEAGADPEAAILKHRDRASLESADREQLRALSARVASRKEPPEGSDAFYELRNSAAVMPDQFTQVDLRLYRGVINERDRQKLMELQADMTARRTGADGKTQKQPRGLLSVEEVANSTLEGLGILPTAKKGKHDPRALAFKTEFDKAVIAEGGAENLNNDQLREIAKRLVKEETRTVAAGKTGKFLNAVTFGAAGIVGIGVDGTETVRAFEMPGDRAFSIGQVPDEYVQEARKFRNKSGRAPTDDEIISAYNANQARTK